MSSPSSWGQQAGALIGQNRLEEAIALLTVETAKAPNDPAPLRALLECLVNANRNPEALALEPRVRSLLPDDRASLLNLGLAAMRTNRYEAAMALFRELLDRDPTAIEPLVNLGATYFGLGMIPEAVEINRRATEARPDLMAVWQNYIAILNYDERLPLETMLAEQRRAGAEISRYIGPRPTDYANVPDPERVLRIGYLSGDMFNHPAAHYVEPVLRCHDRTRCRPIVYSLINWRDVVTDSFRAHVPDWHDVGPLNDQQLFDRIRADGIDILVDLSGHTARNRVTVAARKPAPLVANWVGYLNTMAMPGYDYALLDLQLITNRAAAGFVERPLALPQSAFAYHPLATPRTPAPFPHSAKGVITFGCYNNPAKLSARCLGAWAEILKRVPNSRILFKYKTFDAAIVKDRVTRAFAENGVAAERLVFTGHTPLGQYLDSFAEIDIALDSFPYTGVTTTMHTLYMGVPLVSMDGETPMQRFGNAALRQIGRPDWIATDVDGYVAIAERMVAEIRSAPDLRIRIQEAMLRSPMMRHELVVRGLEDGYRHIWRNWCKSRAAAG